MASKGTKISICIISFNGSLRIVETLGYVSRLIIPENVQLSLVFVDNASTDSTFELVKSYCENHFSQISFVLKQMRDNDLSKARQLAYEGMDSDYVITCDDDNLLPENYIVTGLNYFNENPTIGVLGARGVLKTEGKIPDWFEDNAYYFGCSKQASQTGNVFPERNVVYGAGMWHNHKVYMNAFDLGFKSFIKSRSGKKLGGGEDSELCWAIKYQGYEIWYADDLWFYHKLSESKLNNTYQKKIIDSLTIQIDSYSNLYARVFTKNIPNTVSYFWLKELIYHIKSLIFLPIKITSNKRNAEFKRILSCIKQLAKDRTFYDQRVNDLIKFRDNCSVK
jgi:glycosyltransferase involved in cell wall biosynthesis